jgi:hypothetical protein
MTIEFAYTCSSCGAATNRLLYSSAEAALYLGVTNQTLNRWRGLGYVRSSKVARGYYYQRRDLDECLRLRGYDRANDETEVILR